MLTRRQLLIGTTALAGWPAACARPVMQSGAVLVNDVHAQLSRTRVERVIRVESLDAVQKAVRDARNDGKAISIAGGRHAMGGQQFGAGTVLLDTTGMRRVLRFDPETAGSRSRPGSSGPS